MAGTVKVNAVQLGDSATATQNMVIRTNQDGTFTLARGNLGSTTQDILTIDANGKVLLPQSKGPAFRVYQSTAQSIPGADTVLTLDTKDFDTANAFSTSTYRFQPQVAGYYSIFGSAQSGSGVTNFYVSIFKNGSAYQFGNYVPTSSSAEISIVSTLVFLNGSTDYIDMRALSVPTASTTPGLARVNLYGVLSREA